MYPQAETTRRCPVLVNTLMLAATALATASACSKTTAPAGETAAPSETAPGPAAAAAAPAAAPAQAPAAEPTPGAGAAAEVQGSDRYAMRKDGTQIALGVTPAQGQITFQLATTPSDPKCRLTLAGTAREKGGDVETREDEQGEMIAVSEYVYESKDCSATISLELDTRATAWVSTYDCTLVPEDCWLSTVGPLRKP